MIGRSSVLSVPAKSDCLVSNFFAHIEAFPISKLEYQKDRKDGREAEGSY